MYILVETIPLTQISPFSRIFRFCQNPLDAKAKSNQAHDCEERGVPRIFDDVLLNRDQLVVEVLSNRYQVSEHEGKKRNILGQDARRCSLNVCTAAFPSQHR